MIKLFINWFHSSANFIRAMFANHDRRRYGRSNINWGDVLGLILIGFLIMLFFGVFFCLLAFMLLWPLALAWAINTLFGTAIPITFTTWLAIFVVFWAFKIFTASKVTIEHKVKKD